MAATLNKHAIIQPADSLSHTLLEIYEKISGYFWFTLCLCLFIVLGPFSAPIALIALYKFSAEQTDLPEPESVL